MKKLTIAGLLAAALSLTGLSEQRAAACGGEFGFSIGFSISCNWCRQPCCQPCSQPCYSGCSDMVAYPSNDCAGSYGAYSAYAYPQTAPAVAAPAAAYGVQNAAYTYPTGYGSGYYQAPSYWYGR